MFFKTSTYKLLCNGTEDPGYAVAKYILAWFGSRWITSSRRWELIQISARKGGERVSVQALRNSAESGISTLEIQGSPFPFPYVSHIRRCGSCSAVVPCVKLVLVGYAMTAARGKVRKEVPKQWEFGGWNVCFSGNKQAREVLSQKERLGVLGVDFCLSFWGYFEEAKAATKKWSTFDSKLGFTVLQ